MKPITKAVLYALAEMQHGPRARDMGLWHFRCNVFIAPMGAR